MSTTETTPESTLTLYERIGGAAAVEAAVEVFYKKALADYRVYRYFDGVDTEKLIAKQKAFFTLAFGGPNNYTGADLRTAHSRLVKMGLGNDQFNVILEHLGDTLKELKVPQDLIEEVLTLAESTRNDVLGK
ncbi:MAG: group 1 truncated hemoglobin [Methylococcales bacterium]|nr:group 1 truncated hemoglobin [Methylococcales bacterium]